MKEPEPEVRDLTRTALDLKEGHVETVPEAEDEHSPDDNNELDRNGNGEDKGRQNLKDPREDSTKDSPKNTSAEGGAESAEGAEDSDKSAADGTEITRLGVAYFISHQLEERDHAAGTIERTTSKRSRNNTQQNGSQVTDHRQAGVADSAAGLPGKGKKNPRAKKPRK